MSSVEMNERLAPVVETLVAKSNGKYDTAFVRTLVENVATEFEGARVQDYIEVLVSKLASDELRKLDGLEHVMQ
jgi:hypothetical protein